MKKMLKIKKQKSGFTLLELMVVVAIIGILSSIGFVSLSDSRNQKVVDLEARKVASVLRMAQNYAVSGRIFEASKIPCKFLVVSNAVSKTYSISYTYRSPTGLCGAPELISTYSVASNVAITNMTVDFARPRGDISASAQVDLSFGTASTVVCVQKGGIVKEDC